MNNGHRWDGSACAFTTSYTDNILTVSHNNAGGNSEQFLIVSDEQLERQGFHDVWVGTYGGPRNDITDTRSINSLLGYTRKLATQFYDHASPQVLGHASPNHENMIYLMCPQLTGMRNRGPVMTSGSCVAPLPIQGNYGDVLSYSPDREHRRLMPPPRQINHLDVSLRDSENHEIEMRGSKLSFFFR